jgi:hypothetical protein
MPKNKHHQFVININQVNFHNKIQHLLQNLIIWKIAVFLQNQLKNIMEINKKIIKNYQMYLKI